MIYSVVYRYMNYYKLAVEKDRDSFFTIFTTITDHMETRGRSVQKPINLTPIG